MLDVIVVAERTDRRALDTIVALLRLEGFSSALSAEWPARGAARCVLAVADGGSAPPRGGPPTCTVRFSPSVVAPIDVIDLHAWDGRQSHPAWTQLLLELRRALAPLPAPVYPQTQNAFAFVERSARARNRSQTIVRTGLGAILVAAALVALADPFARRATTPTDPSSVAQADETALPGVPALWRGPTPGATSFRDCFVCPEMVRVPPGLEWGAAPDPLFTRAFAIAKFEVRADEWQACVHEGGCRHDPVAGRSADLPVSDVNWRDARAYAAWLSRKTGEKYRLPTEAEWEYAARAGQPRRWDANDLCDGANHADAASPYPWRNMACEDGFKGAAPVGRFRANALGLHDVLGNVWEWVEDCTQGDAGACAGPQRMLKGGSWAEGPSVAQIDYRFFADAETRSEFYGFRVLREIGAP